VIQHRLGAAPLLPIVFLLVCGCGQQTMPAGTNQPPRTHLQPTSPSTVIDTFHSRSLGCGTRLDGPVVVSRPGDPIRFTITGFARQAADITVTYAITTLQKGRALNLPIESIPPTVFLMRDGRIVGLQAPVSTPLTMSGETSFMLYNHPYTGTLTIDRTCPGTTWAAVRDNPAGYQVEVAMTPQPRFSAHPETMPRYTTDPLTVAVAVLK